MLNNNVNIAFSTFHHDHLSQMIMKTICLVKNEDHFGPDFPGDEFIEIFVLNQNGSRKATRFSGCYARA